MTDKLIVVHAIPVPATTRLFCSVDGRRTNYAIRRPDTCAAKVLEYENW